MTEFARTAFLPVRLSLPLFQGNGRWGGIGPLMLGILVVGFGLGLVGCEGGEERGGRNGNDDSVVTSSLMPYDPVRIQSFRAEKDAFLRESPNSPIPTEERKTFIGLPYFPPDSSFAVTADYKIFDEPKQVTLMTTSGEPRPMLRAGEFQFTLQGESLKLTAYKSPEDGRRLFVPFRDATNDSLSYGAGRYLDITEGRGVAYTLDFNYAYSPYCAYNQDYSCPVVPLENILPVEIRAGEKTYGAHDDKQNR